MYYGHDKDTMMKEMRDTKIAIACNIIRFFSVFSRFFKASDREI